MLLFGAALLTVRAVLTARTIELCAAHSGLWVVRRLFGRVAHGADQHLSAILGQVKLAHDFVDVFSGQSCYYQLHTFFFCQPDVLLAAI